MASAIAVVSGVAPLSTIASASPVVGGQRAPVSYTLPLGSGHFRQSSFTGRAMSSSRRSSTQRQSSRDSQEVRAAVEPDRDVDTDEITEQLKDQLKGVQQWWDRQEDKYAIVGLGVAGIVALWASSGLLSSIDRLPVLPGFFEFVGILFTGWFVYRYLLFKPDREELVQLLDDTKKKITGEE